MVSGFSSATERLPPPLSS